MTTVQKERLPYVGCYADAGKRDLPKIVNIGHGNNVKFCMNRCKDMGYAYAGLQASTWCACGNQYGGTVLLVISVI